MTSRKERFYNYGEGLLTCGVLIIVFLLLLAFLSYSPSLVLRAWSVFDVLWFFFFFVASLLMIAGVVLMVIYSD